MDKVLRKWCYCQYPSVYEVYCDKCGGDNTTWSEYERHIWCFDCQEDTPGTQGIFGGPIPVHLCGLFGITFDRIDLVNDTILKFDMDDMEYK